MPRNHHPGASTLRNRNRVTNKTRLKIHHGNLDADDPLIPDEDEEKHRITNLVAGVDAEDANEHHLQEVLSASQRTHIPLHRSTRGASEKINVEAPPAAFIPTPDSTGVVDNYEEYYPANRWKDPATYVCSSTNVEEAVANALANGFTYYMDERDKEWLDKNNEEARGEGTSAQGAVSASGTRTSARSAKAKGKEPEVSQPIVISEDEFELVMGLLEKVTHEKTEFLPYGLETGMTFPPFSDYQETFSSPLVTTMFTSFTVPTWVPPPATLLRIARCVYPYWKERRLEREGHRIIPTLNGDETDTLNESYICFRRREIKAVRKTRASQVTSSDKLARLQAELSFPLELAKSILSRETLKKENAQQAQGVWDKRLALVDLKRKFPALGDKGDEELLIDKERPVKKPETSRVPLKIKTTDAGIHRPEVSIRPKERVAMIREQIESTLLRQKDLDHHWDDQIDNVYQPPLVPYTSRFFKFIKPSDTPQSSPSDSDKTEEETGSPISRAVRVRIGRGGRRLIDRHEHGSRSVTLKPRSTLFGGDAMEVDNDDRENAERFLRIQERWRFDADDVPGVGPQGLDEQDRILVDDFDSKYMRHTMSLFSDVDQQSLSTDPSLLVTGPDGRQHMQVPFRLGIPLPIMRRDPAGMMRPVHPSIVMQQNGMVSHPVGVPLSSINGTPVSVQQQLKKMPPPSAVPQMRISSNGGMRPPGLPSSNIQGTNPTTHSSPPQPIPVPVPQHSPPNGVNGMSRAAISMPHVEVIKTEVMPTTPISNGPVNQLPDATHLAADLSNAGTLLQKAQNQLHMAIPPNGFHLTPMTPSAAAALANSAQYYSHSNAQHGGLSMQQVQTLKTAFANMQGQDVINQNGGRALPGSYMHVVHNGVNMMSAQGSLNLKLPTARQMQWSASGSPMQRPSSAMNGIDGPALNGTLSSSPTSAHSIPVRSPSANGTRVALRNGNGHVIGANGQISMSPLMQHSPSPIPSISQSQSPPRLPMTPTMGMASPSLQHQQPVGSTQGGY